MTPLKYHIIIIGAGPTGLVLANLLGASGLSIVLIEKEKDVFPIPRATHIDEETLRNFQATGLMHLLETHTAPFGSVHITNAKGAVLLKEEVIQPNSSHYYVGSRFFDQPAFEDILREGLQRFPNIHFFTGFEAKSIVQDANEVTLVIQDAITHEYIELHADWLVGCDGGRSIVRSTLNIDMEALESARDWIIADTLLKHPDDAKLLPDGFQYIFEDERLTIYAHGIGIHRRWEFQLNKDEVMPDEATIKSWVSKYISLDKIMVTRISKYAHNSLVAKQWKCNHIFLAGDAAHMMPPSAGQGLCSGVRDAVNLAWKLEAVIKKQFDASLLNTYEQERKPHLYKILHRTLFFGKTLQADTAFSRFLRNIQLRTIQSFSPLKNYLRIKYNTPPVVKEGFLSNTSVLAGHHVPQVKLAGGEFSDAIIGYRFVCIGLPGNFTAAQLHFLKERNIGLLHEQTDIMQTSFPAWLAEHDIEFALVRPDKIICTAGKMDAFDLLLHPFNLYSDLRS